MGTTSPTRADARRNHERLLAAARKEFARHGTGVPLEDVARRAGVGIGTLYRHFPTREALVEAVYREGYEALHAKAGELLAGPVDADAVAAWLRAFIQHANSCRGMPASVKATIMDRDTGLGSAAQAAKSAWADLLEQAQRAGVVRGDARAPEVLRLVHSIAWATENAPDGPEMTERMLTLVMDGMQKR